MTEEEWRPVVGAEGKYSVSSHGRVKSEERTTESTAGWFRKTQGGILTPGTDKDGYLQVAVSYNHVFKTVKIHKLVAQSFLGPCPEGLIVCHKDGVNTHNRPANLRYDTHSSNNLDHVRHGNHHYAKRDACKHGHIYNEASTRWRSDGKGRECRTCAAVAMSAYKDRKRRG